ncbi:competence type IV pilus assembly protein ComGB [Priestia endophytica]|uniref:competence type IV pilus assembly protein ComGB n=1 Tax=Priestia endophytica TaxID=135735 RepID=UPI000F527C61|nr:competence type IV pilus assembly protein ComGB [Priestia endophytica]
MDTFIRQYWKAGKHMIKKTKQKKPLREQAQLLTRLSSLLEKGYTMSQALEFLRLQGDKKLQTEIRSCLTALKKGRPLHEAFQFYELNKEALIYLYFAEQHGDISFALKESGRLTNEKAQQLIKIRKVIQYPLLLFLFLIGLFMTMSFVLIPQFSSLYSSMNEKPSFFLLTFFFLANHFPLLFLTFIIIMVGNLFYCRAYLKRLSPAQRVRFLSRLPIFGPLYKSFCSYSLSAHLGNLLKGGLSINESLQAFCRQKHSPFFQGEGKRLELALTRGRRLPEIIAEVSYYELELSQIVSHGQSNGNLAQELCDYSALVIEKLEGKITKIISIVQPLLFSLIGLTVLCLYLAIMIPMFQAMSSL